MNIASNDFVNIRAQDGAVPGNFVFQDLDFQSNSYGSAEEENVSVGKKRNLAEYDVQSFFNDMKKQKLPAVYNSGMASILDNVGKFILDDSTNLLDQQTEQDKEQYLSFFEALKEQIDFDITDTSLEGQPDFDGGYSFDFSSNNIPDGDFNSNSSNAPAAQPILDDFTFGDYALDSQFSAPFTNDTLYSPCPVFPPEVELSPDESAGVEFDIMQLPDDSGLPNDIFPHLEIAQQPEFVFGMASETAGTIPVDDSSDILYPFLDLNSGQLFDAAIEPPPSAVGQIYANPLRKGSRTNLSAVEVQDESSTPELDFSIPEYTSISLFSQMNAPGQTHKASPAPNSVGRATGSDRRSKDQYRKRLPANPPIHRARSVSPAKSESLQVIQTFAARRRSHSAINESTRDLPLRHEHSSQSRSAASHKKKVAHLNLVESIIQKLRTSNPKPAAKQSADEDGSPDLMEKLQARLEAIRLGGKAA
ncbi:hypothetical protein K493DRAFT_5637 [Basidiobolus meristosporus CBS 931.73]|uniref:Uncharacterized protein n=1 Tax=Basidiobolus meristosporus CBS 931.73 TaxID=1314790 RepID=A0A1Y1YKW8_9FUNG|nr:hypothetical protein K493DRAFT_5637 [Basidiobolus meristosporus CBS 931.73]|eukprot:ORX98638.1 hypothetical protein K493DRAFT_5637 [Basidiobolus meristosporus CBS 931.73]